MRNIQAKVAKATLKNLVKRISDANDSLKFLMQKYYQTRDLQNAEFAECFLTATIDPDPKEDRKPIAIAIYLYIEKIYNLNSNNENSLLSPTCLSNIKNFIKNEADFVTLYRHQITQEYENTICCNNLIQTIPKLLTGLTAASALTFIVAATLYIIFAYLAKEIICDQTTHCDNSLITAASGMGGTLIFGGARCCIQSKPGPVEEIIAAVDEIIAEQEQGNVKQQASSETDRLLPKRQPS